MRIVSLLPSATEIVSGLSAPAELLVSDIVRGLARTSAGVEFDDRESTPSKALTSRTAFTRCARNSANDRFSSSRAVA